MKTGAVFKIKKSRDYYDFLFLSGSSDPDFGYLEKKFGISNFIQMYERILESCETIDFKHKSRDFEKFVSNPPETRKRFV